MNDDLTILERRPWIILGAGRLGRTLGLLAGKLGIRLAGTWNRTADSAAMTRHILGDVDVEIIDGEPEDALAAAGPPRVIWLTVVDDAVESVARRLVPSVDASDLVIHTSGVASSEVLRRAGLTRCHVGSLHVLQAVTDPMRAVESLGESTWSAEGDEAVVEFGRSLLARLGVEPLVVDASQKALYHASAVTTANLMVALMDAAFEMAERAGLSRKEAREMLLPLARSSVENLAEQSTLGALSGPVARGDRTTLEMHRRALEAMGDSGLAEIYEALTERAKKLAASKWGDQED